MIKFRIADPQLRQIVTVEAPSFKDIKASIFATQGVDFGMLTRDIGYVVYEFGLLEPSPKGYVAFGPQLCAGKVLLFGTDERGETVDITDRPIDRVQWFADVAEVEVAIAAGTVRRPQSAINGLVYWQWPNPPAKGMRP